MHTKHSNNMLEDITVSGKVQCVCHTADYTVAVQVPVKIMDTQKRLQVFFDM